MSYPNPIQNITRSSGTATTTPAKIPANQRDKRSCVKLTNTGANAIYVYLTSQNASAPTISGAAFDFAINPDEFLAFPAGDAIGVWIATLASTSTYEMLEADGDPAALAASSVSGSASVSGTVALASEKVEDTASSGGDTLMGVGGVTFLSTPGQQTGADGDFGFLILDRNGRLRINHQLVPQETGWTRGGRITTATTTNVKNDGSSTQYLVDIALTNLGTAANSIVIQDQAGSPNELFRVTLQGGQGCITSLKVPRPTSATGSESGIDIVTSSGEDIDYSLGGF